MWGLLDIFAFGIGEKENNGPGGCLVIVLMFVIVATIQGIVSLCSSDTEPVFRKPAQGGQQIVERAGEQTGKSFRSFTKGLWNGLRDKAKND